MQPPQSYSVGGQRSSGQLTGKPAGAQPDYRGRWYATLANISFSCMRLNLHSIPPEIPSSAEKLDFSFNDLGTLHRNSFPSLPYLIFLDLTSHDENWVMDELVENLENGVPPIELCLHNRDFQPGQLITSNILEEGIMSNRKVIVVLSKNLIASRWCKFEFDMARSWQFLEGAPGIIVIVLEDIKEEEIKHVFRLHKYLKKNTYLKWKDNALSSTRFWTRLRKAVLSGKR
ncbi:UNVERIFIED_CONTAM: hypothetical protein FKN15_053235 [Acipenser sinensis]